MRGIAVRDELTGEWSKRGVKEKLEYAILTAEISQATFGMTPSEYKDFKSLSSPNDNLRDHMTDLELIFTMLGEASTTEIAREKNAKGFPENKIAANEGGKIAGDAKKALEKKTGRNVSTKENYKEIPEAKKKALKHKKQFPLHQIKDQSEEVAECACDNEKVPDEVEELYAVDEVEYRAERVAEPSCKYPHEKSKRHYRHKWFNGDYHKPAHCEIY